MRHQFLSVLFAFPLACSGSSSSGTTPPPTDGATESATDSSGTETAADDGTDSSGPCAGKTCTDPGFACDPEDGNCKPDGKTTHVGDPCDTSGPADPKCGTYSKATCNDLTSDGFPGGYCSVEPCTTKDLCPIGASCGTMGGESAACYKNCKTDADCRAPDYKCQPMDQLWISGASKKVCHLAKLPCTTASTCPTSLPKCTSSVCGA